MQPPCDLCEAVPVQSHCEVCDITLCGNCAVKHISDSSKRHDLVHYLQNKSTSNYLICLKHAEKHCELYCEKCDIPVCSTCVSSGKHKGHRLSDILENLEIFSAKRQKLQQELEELDIRISPRYEEMASDIRVQKEELERIYGKLTKDADQQGEILHREVTAIVNRRKSDIQEMKTKHLSTLDKNTDEITQKITELKQIIADLNSRLKSNDVSLTSTYKSRNSDFRTLPPKVRVTLPSFSPGKVNKDQLNEMFGSLSSLFINIERVETMESAKAVLSPPVKPMKSPEAVSSPPVKPMKSPEAVSSPPVKPMKSPEAVSSPPFKPIRSPEAVSSPPVKPMKSPEAISSPPVKPMKLPEAVSSPPVKPMTSPEAASSPPVKPMTSPEAVSSPPIKHLLDEPRLIAITDTGHSPKFTISCLGEDKFWTCTGGRNDGILKLHNVQGTLLSSIKTKSRNRPGDLTVTQGGDVVYTDATDRTVYLVKNKEIRAVITLQGWEPCGICSTASDDLLVIMVRDDGTQSKVVRYSGFTETQSIQFDDRARLIYSSGGIKGICENKNLDICVADYHAKAVVVVNRSGKLRFRYTGYPSNTGPESFYPEGITTDSQSYILTADGESRVDGRIHILDQDGQFLRYIHNLHDPTGLCVDSRDNLFVTELYTAKVKKIQYLESQC